MVEASEDCDTFAPNVGAVCRPKGMVGECHLECRVRSDGTRSPCPKDWGCSTEGICRPPTGDFEQAVDYTNSGAWTLQSGDFDGDGRDEIIGLEALRLIWAGAHSLSLFRCPGREDQFDDLSEVDIATHCCRCES